MNFYIESELALAALFITHAYYTFSRLRGYLHILQLNGYFNSRFFRWLRRSPMMRLREFEPLVGFIGIIFGRPLLAVMLSALAYLRLVLSRPLVQEKKSLVFTARVIRLFIATIVIILGIYGVLRFFWQLEHTYMRYYLIPLLVCITLMLPYLLIVANWLLTPIEYLIRSYYLHLARSKLKSLPQLKVVGITGSFGKTSTKYVTAALLGEYFRTLKTPASYNTLMGVTKTILEELRPLHECLVVEMGAKQPGDIKEICELVRPQYGLITAIGEQHLETFQTIARVRATKNELIASLPAGGTAFLNLDDEHCRTLIAGAPCKVVTYGIANAGAHYGAEEIVVDSRGSRFRLVNRHTNQYVMLHTQLLGHHNIYNIVAGAAIAAELGVPLAAMAAPIRRLDPIPHRLELKRLANNITFIDDAFNSNPVGSTMAVEVLASFNGGRKIIVTPGMVELGMKEWQYNHEFGVKLARVCDYIILVGHKQTAAVQAGLIQEHYPNNQLFLAGNFGEAKEHLESILQSNDVVLFENDLPDQYNET